MKKKPRKKIKQKSRKRKNKRILKLKKKSRRGVAKKKIIKKIDNILTIIIPRHTNRVKKIEKDLSKLNLKICFYSQIEKMSSDVDILLIDTYGEVEKFYNISKCVFLGKSLIESLKKDSGQNPIEAARIGCKIFHGPNISNFSEIYEFLKSLGISKKITSPEELSQSLVEELKENKVKNEDTLKKIENYGSDTLNNVIREIKIYISN